MEQDFRHLPEDLLVNFEVQLQEIIRKILTLSRKKISLGRKLFNDALKFVDSLTNPPTEELCFDNPLHRAVYLFNCTPCYTSAAAHHFLDIVKSNHLIFKNLIDSKNVKICCLGGGPATEALAIIKVLTSIKEHFDKDSSKPSRYDVTIVDKIFDWKITAFKIVPNDKIAIDNVKRSKINVHFLTADITEPLTEDVQKILQEAEIVTMVAFISSIWETFSSNIHKLVQDVVKYMKPTGILFYLDIGKNLQCHVLHKSLNVMKNVKCIYGLFEVQPFNLSKEAMEKNMDLFYELFYQNICLPGAIINACAWVKTDSSNRYKSFSKNQGLNLQKDTESKIQWEKTAKESEEILKNYLVKVERLLNNKKHSPKKPEDPRSLTHPSKNSQFHQLKREYPESVYYKKNADFNINISLEFSGIYKSF